MTIKEQLLGYLKENNGNWVSGELLSDMLGVTRSAIWKQICALREEGYIIDSSTNKGYILKGVPEMLLPAEIRAHLDTDIFGRKDIEYLIDIDSTNIRAGELASKGAPEGSLVIAENQAQGRGRKGRAWFSFPREGIYVSLVLRPQISPAEAPKITLLTGVALADALISITGLPVKIKWPNDLLINGKKVSGILTEISTEMDSINYVIVGVGLNVNSSSLPDDIRDKATTIFLETGKTFSRLALVREFLKWMEKYYMEFKNKGFQSIRERWKELSNIAGRRIRVEMVDRILIGEARGIDEDGVLIVEDDDGTLHRIFSGDIFIL